ncbi:SRPBCC family protein [Micromonospora sp. WMMA1363]|uniref:SRPBCC family protein n=1 Tax=Micromonospora sp. WMMA1363 TaxID=3053985 RepID=UPI00259C7910|nr:SRPBCC family protein [Micromonospora sp. WMMA1363]MDM4721224.1 SRPBCC family protein [Micromonospora sp. WMMA1363]
MSSVAVTRSIEAHAVDVWRLLTDLTVRARATRGLEVLTPGGFGPGTAWREVRSRPDGSALTEEFVVVAAEPPRRLVLGSPGAGVDYTVTWTLRPVRRRGRGCTMVTVTQEAIPTAPSGRVVALLLGGLAARAVEGALRRDLAALAAATRTNAEAA